MENKPKIEFIDLKKQNQLIRNDLDIAIKKVLDHGQYIMGPEVALLEEELCSYTQSKYCISCANGTDAISLVLMSWDVSEGDAIFLPDFTYVATAETIALLGATPFFVDVDRSSFNLDPESLKKAITVSKKAGMNPKAVITVELFGNPSDYDSINEIAKSENLKLMIDAAQGFGGIYKESYVGSYADATTTSFFPAKPLGCYGDGGAIFCNNDELENKLKSLRLHGKGKHKYEIDSIGMNSRLDTIQAAILLEKLKIFDKELNLKNKLAEIYSDKIGKYVKTPSIDNFARSAWAQYTIQTDRRDELSSYLFSKGIPNVVYYPKPLSEQLAYKKFPNVSQETGISKDLTNSVLSLPMHAYFSENEMMYICDSILDFFIKN